jgi:hypothetical protein
MSDYSDTPSVVSRAVLGQTERLPGYSGWVADEELVHPIDEAWKNRVRKALDNQGRGAQSRLAKAIGIGTGQLSEMLGADSKYSRYVAKIHAYFGWDPPPAPLGRDASEISHLVRPLSKRQRQRVGLLLEQLSDLPADEIDARLEAMIALSGLKPKSR